MAGPNKAKPAGQKPVSAHPLFPAIVALWFAALLGIGSLVLPQALYDKLGVAMGLGSLGFSARLGMAVAAGAVGAALGLFLARKAAASHSARQPQASANKTNTQPAKAKRPISAMEELGSDRLDEPLTQTGSEPFSGRRRSLAVTDESGPSEYLAHVPLPGGESTLDLIGADLLDEEDALDLDNYEQPLRDDPAPPVRAEAEPVARQMFQPPAPELAAPEPAAEFTRSSRHYDGSEPDWSTEPAAPIELVNEPGPAPFAASSAAAAPRPFSPPPPFGEPAAPFAGPVAAAPPPSFAAPVQAAPFAMPQPSLNPAPPLAHDSPSIAPVDASNEIAALAAAARPVFAPLPSAERERQHSLQSPAPSSESLTGPALTGPALTGLALTDLIERFALALRRADPASLTEAVPAGLRRFAPAPDSVEPVADAAAASAAAFGPADLSALVQSVPAAPFAMPSMPAALQPITYDAHDDDDDGEELFDYPFTLTTPPKPFAAPGMPLGLGAPAAPFGIPQVIDTAPEEPADEVEQAETGEAFGSLLAMKSGFGQGKEFVRVDEEPAAGEEIEPVVVFPGMASPGRAVPAPDGPSREPAAAAPFAPPPFAQSGFARVPFGKPQVAPSDHPAALDRNATEQALRDALAKLQQMSGAA